MSSVRIIVAGAAPVPEPMLRLYGARGIPVSQCWGLTEAATGATFRGTDRALDKLGSLRHRRHAERGPSDRRRRRRGDDARCARRTLRARRHRDPGILEHGRGNCRRTWPGWLVAHR
ncbi:hypothetical protein [Rhodococcus wratislaviensis]|uniref:hypothetical protein n=1 Tax=Rhodococcus wratislaviensis TaxID=44752 RepID=UPI003510E92E